MTRLTSPKNPLLQSIRRAAKAGRPMDEGLIVVEGPHLLQEALRGLWHIEQVLVTAESRTRHADLLREVNAEIIEVSARALDSASSTEHTQEILVLLRPRRWEWQDLTTKPALIVALDSIQDPGNAGTILRSAEAFGATGLVFLEGSAHVSNGKLLRASAGSVFRVPYLEGITCDDLLFQVRSNGWRLFGLSTKSETSIADADLLQPCVLAVGNEGQGLSPRLLSRAQPLSIPITKVESLNAAIACSITLFEVQRQRTRT